MRDEKLKYLLVFPAIAVVFITAIWPLVESFRLSFTIGRLNRPGSLDRYLGFENYAWAFFDDPAFWNSVGVTAIYTVLTVGLATLLALGLALLLAPGGRFRSGVQTLLILPFAMSPALIGISFRFMFDPEFGLFDAFFGVLIPPLADVSWLANPICGLRRLAHGDSDDLPDLCLRQIRLSEELSGWTQNKNAGSRRPFNLS